MKKARGRPRQYDEDKVLQAAEQVFWQKGYSATSLDDLAGAMGMNRPSIYRAFGDKEAIYRKVLMLFCQKMESVYGQTMLDSGDIRQRLKRFYSGALRVYTADAQAKGCLVMSTAVAAAYCHPDIQSDLFNIIRDLDNKLSEQFQQAITSGEVSSSASGESRGAMAQSLLHSLSLRARAGESPRRLTQLIDSGVEMITA